MAVGSALGGSFGIGVQSIYSNAVSIDRFYEVESASLRRNKRTVQGGGIAGGVMFARSNRRRQPTQDAVGSVELEVPDRFFGRVLTHLTGSTASVGPLTGGGYAQTYPLADNAGRHLTCQIGIPEADGEIKNYLTTGTKITGAEFSQDVDGFLMASLDLDARSIQNDATYITPTYAAGVSGFTAEHASTLINIGGNPVEGVRAFNLSLSRPMATERFYFGGAGLKDEPIQNGMWEVTGSFDCDLIDKADLADRNDSDAAASLTITIYKSAASYVTFTMPAVHIDGDTPGLEGEDIVTGSYSFSALFNGTDSPLSIVYQSVDNVA